VQFGRLADDDGYAFFVDRATVGIAQFDIVVAGPKRVFLGLRDLVRKTAVDEDRRILAIRLNLHESEVRGHVIGRIRVRVRIGEEWVEDPFHCNHLPDVHAAYRKQCMNLRQIAITLTGRPRRNLVAFRWWA
jgi:hypothetical protein